MSAQLSLPLERRNDAMQRVESKANRISAGWTEQAETLLSRFLAARIGPFITEQFADWAEANGLPVLAERRVFGPVMNRASRQGWVVKVGYRVDRFCSPKTLWLASV